MDNVNRDGNPKEKKKEMLEVKQTTEMEMPLMSLIIDWIQLRKVSLSLRTQQKLPKVKKNEAKKKKRKKKISEKCGITKKGVKYV